MLKLIRWEKTSLAAKSRERLTSGERKTERKKGVCLVWMRHEKGGEMEEESRAGF